MRRCGHLRPHHEGGRLNEVWRGWYDCVVDTRGGEYRVRASGLVSHRSRSGGSQSLDEYDDQRKARERTLRRHTGATAARRATREKAFMFQWWWSEVDEHAGAEGLQGISLAMSHPAERCRSFYCLQKHRASGHTQR